ncbi:MAG: hypothetical protein AAGH40_00760 [Verrucomicrobiota bacterium]
MNRFEDLIEWTKQIDQIPEGPIYYVVIAIAYLLILFSAYWVTLKGIFDQFPAFKKLVVYGLLEQVIIFTVIGTLSFVVFQVAEIAEQSLSGQQSYVSGGIFITVGLLLGIGFLLLKRFIVSNMIDIEVTFMQTITVAVMHLFYSYLIPGLVAVIISLALKPFTS